MGLFLNSVLKLSGAMATASFEEKSKRTRDFLELDRKFTHRATIEQFTSGRYKQKYRYECFAENGCLLFLLRGGESLARETVFLEDPQGKYMGSISYNRKTKWHSEYYSMNLPDGRSFKMEQEVSLRDIATLRHKIEGLDWLVEHDMSAFLGTVNITSKEGPIAVVRKAGAETKSNASTVHYVDYIDESVLPAVALIIAGMSGVFMPLRK